MENGEQEFSDIQFADNWRWTEKEGEATEKTDRDGDTARGAGEEKRHVSEAVCGGCGCGAVKKITNIDRGNGDATRRPQRYQTRSLLQKQAPAHKKKKSLTNCSIYPSFLTL